MTARLVALCGGRERSARSCAPFGRTLSAGRSTARPVMRSVSCQPMTPTFRIVFRPVPETKTGRNRIHLDLTTTSLDDQHESVSRLVESGARHIDIGQSPDEPHVVLADPESNEFCVIEPENSFLAGCGRVGALSCDGSRQVGYFWSNALGWPLVWDQDEETAIRAPDGTGPFITWGGGPPAPKIGKNRLHLDIAPTEHVDQHVEVDRLVSLGRRKSTSARAPSAG